MGDDTLLSKQYSTKIELVHYQYSGAVHDVIPGILISNLPFGQWHSSLAQDSALPAAILDRLLFHPAIYNIKDESFRLKDTKNAGFVPKEIIRR